MATANGDALAAVLDRASGAAAPQPTIVARIPGKSRQRFIIPSRAHLPIGPVRMTRGEGPRRHAFSRKSESNDRASVTAELFGYGPPADAVSARSVDPRVIASDHDALDRLGFCHASRVPSPVGMWRGIR